MKTPKDFGSLCVHELKSKVDVRPHLNPIYATSSFSFDSIDQGIAIFSGQEEGHVYGRYGNPTIDLVAQKIALLEGYDLEEPPVGIMCSSGMSAISTLLIALLNKGDKVLTQGNLYGGTTELLVKIFGTVGIEPEMTDLKDFVSIEDKLKADKDIKLLYFETPANPSMACVDIEALAKLGKKYNVYTVIDNTFCTPYLQRPLTLGVDFVIHSTTKFLNGHGNSIAGVIIGKDKGLMKDKVWQAMKLLGTNCNPFDAWMVNTGMKTLELRMDRHSQNGMAVAKFLETHSKVKQVNYTGLPSHPDHEIANKQMSQHGAMLSFELDGGLEDGIRFMNAIKFCTLAPTLGDIDTLILHPASSSHLNIPKEIREANGITDGLIRLSVGIESAVDIIADLKQAL
ncbi:MAG: aminotransferase class I/II-fold pyridoxal phosphate-dependent enzyme [Bacteroidota bacterium]